MKLTFGKYDGCDEQDCKPENLQPVEIGFCKDCDTVFSTLVPTTNWTNCKCGNSSFEVLNSHIRFMRKDENFDRIGHLRIENPQKCSSLTKTKLGHNSKESLTSFEDISYEEDQKLHLQYHAEEQWQETLKYYKLGNYSESD